MFYLRSQSVRMKATPDKYFNLLREVDLWLLQQGANFETLEELDVLLTEWMDEQVFGGFDAWKGSYLTAAFSGPTR